MKKNIFLLILAIAVLVVVLLGCAQTKAGNVPEAATSDTVQIPDDGTEEQTAVAADKEKEKMVGEGKIEIIETDPLKGEYFIYAILEEIYAEDNLIRVKQLINDASDREIDPIVPLEKDCLIVKVMYSQDQDGQTSEVLEKINIEDIETGSEIGIIFTADDKARAVLYLTDHFVE